MDPRQGTPLVPLRADRAMHFPLLMHLADLALAALAHDARVVGTPLDTDAMLERFYGWTVTDWERALRSLAEDLPQAMFELVVDEPTLPAYLQPPIAGLIANKLDEIARKRARQRGPTNEPLIWELADKVTPDDLNPLGQHSIHGRHHGSWPCDAETWSLALIVRQTAGAGVGRGFLGALRGTRRAYASLHAQLDSASIFEDDVKRAIVDRGEVEAQVEGKDRGLLLRRRPALLWGRPWGTQAFYRPIEIDLFFTAPATPVRLVEGPGGRLKALMVQWRGEEVKRLSVVRRAKSEPAWTEELRDPWMAVRSRTPTAQNPDPLEPRDHLSEIYAQDVVVAFIEGTDDHPSELPITMRIGRKDADQRGHWWWLVLSGFCSQREDPYREVLIEAEVGPEEANPSRYLLSRRWVRQLQLNNRAFHTTWEALEEHLRTAFGAPRPKKGRPDPQPDIPRLADDARRRFDAVFFRELRRGLEADDHGEGWRRLLREAARAAFDRFEREHPLEEPAAMKRFRKALGELENDLAKL